MAVPATPHTAALSTPFYDEQCNDKERAAALTLEDSAFNFVSGLGYTLVPALGAEEAAALLSWALPPEWAGDGSVSDELRASRLAAALHNAAVLGACTQVEYFFFGTDNGHAFLMPLLPPHLLEALVAECGETTLPELAHLWKRETELAQAAACGDALAARAIAEGGRAPLNCVGRRLLHRHAREEPVTVMDHLGTLFASAASSGDTSVAVSMFHPVPVGITCLPHPSAVRCTKLWEGSAFTATPSRSNAGEESDTPLQGALQRWHDAVHAAEPTAVYVFTGDDAGLVRLWRVDVVARSYTLQHVLMCSANMTGMLSPLSPFAREDNSKKVPSRDADRVVHCLEVDELAGRVFAGTEGGVYVWAINALPWRGAESPSADALAAHHPLCWDEERQAPLPCALLRYEASLRRDSDADNILPTASSANSEKIVEYRASRLANHHVWVLPASLVQSEIARAMERGGSSAGLVSRWKPKHGRMVTGGAAVGVVWNTVKLSTAAVSGRGATVGDRLTDTVVPVSFEGGELRNGLRVPLSCVVPVVYPLAFLRTPGTACFALRVLAGNRRLVTSCADGRVCVWTCRPDKDACTAVAETYVPQLVTNTRQEHRGLGRHVCVLRTPDVFVTCSYDDGLVKEWHVYDEPEALLRCARRFTLTPYSSEGGRVQQQQQQLADAFTNMHKPKTANAAIAGGNSDEVSADDGEDGDVVGGISCAAAYPAFGALFLVGVFESVIQTYSLTEVAGCEPPRNYVYNGHKTVRLPASMAEDVYHKLPAK